LEASVTISVSFLAHSGLFSAHSEPFAPLLLAKA
jgi:hypothetical protein